MVVVSWMAYLASMVSPCDGPQYSGAGLAKQGKTRRLCRRCLLRKPGGHGIRGSPLERRPPGGRIIPPLAHCSRRRCIMSVCARVAAVASLALLLLGSAAPTAAAEPQPDFR